MLHGYLRQATASQSIIVGPFIDDTDFKSPETALTIANTDVKLMKSGGTSVNKNSGSGTHRVNGMYSLTLDATDTSAVGELSGSIVVSGALPVVFKFFVLEEVVYDQLFVAGASGNTTQLDDIQAAILTVPTADQIADEVETRTIAATTVADKTGYSLSPVGLLAIYNGVTPEMITDIDQPLGTIGRIMVDQFATIDKMDPMLEPDGDAFRFTQPALAQAPSDAVAIAGLSARLPAALESGKMASTIDTGVVEGGLTWVQSMRLNNAAAAGRIIQVSPTELHIAAASNPGQVRITATVDANGNRVLLVLDPN